VAPFVVRSVTVTTPFVGTDDAVVRRLPSGVRLSPPAARRLTRFGIAPLLDPRYPVALRRRLLDASGAVSRLPRGARHARGSLGGVPTTVAVAGGPGEHRVLYLHGGGYQVGSARAYRGLLTHLSRMTGAPVHAPDYRLAPEHPYPAAAQDAHAAFRALRNAGHPAQRIAIAGDSAGGGLAMTLLLRLRAAGEELPGSVGLISPWLDLTCSAPAITANAASDAMLHPTWLSSAANSYGWPVDAADLRPLEADLAGLPPLHVVAGADELLVDDADRLVERARAAGVAVTYRRVEGMWHAFPVLAGLLAEADAALAELGAALHADCTRTRTAG
jgi:monoterpene epsilon-lactone hydrolase